VQASQTDLSQGLHMLVGTQSICLLSRSGSGFDHDSFHDTRDIHPHTYDTHEPPIHVSGQYDPAVSLAFPPSQLSCGEVVVRGAHIPPFEGQGGVDEGRDLVDPPALLLRALFCYASALRTYRWWIEE
jgi:hypothetical protein